MKNKQMIEVLLRKTPVVHRPADQQTQYNPMLNWNQASEEMFVLEEEVKQEIKESFNKQETAPTELSPKSAILQRFMEQGVKFVKKLKSEEKAQMLAELKALKLSRSNKE
ncbi:Hypothetical_protein [Hexamita inflata]|uniref:Hypothetical_protein n=1 Tax=Hexamita inflata TaxID=28002 RepID=A0AA86Q6N2_9EUKA|nr:Hypothetical protein HINF_LOCUS10591 [Hexamita inflata]CAI9951617.1 Hypothetical protein HINF_LOCUS39262 [Hexamita inflata]CAI9951621.1 Hypothetical protein HINF_LOCUS39266 [Hexamita inflata]